MRNTVIALTALTLVGLAFAVPQRAHAVTPNDTPNEPEPAPAGEAIFYWPPGQDDQAYEPPATVEVTQDNITDTSNIFTDFSETAVHNQNLAAMLAAIKACEGTANQPDPYRVCFGYRHTIQNLQAHPAVSGEWRGEKLSDAMCAGAGRGPGCVSTAAGAYQMIKPTWLGLAQRLGLRDFGPTSQDAAAGLLLRDCGALQKLNRGDLAGAVQAARRTWASLPGAGYGQGEKTLAWVADRYLEAGGVIA